MRDRSILPLILAALLIAWGQGWIGGGGDIIPDGMPLPIKVDTPAALFAVDYETITAPQAQTAASMKVRTYATENGIDWRKYDVESDLTAEEQHWQDMMAAAREKGGSRLVLANKQGGRVDEIPETPEAAIEIIGGIK